MATKVKTANRLLVNGTREQQEQRRPQLAVAIPKVNRQQVELLLIGDSPLLCNRKSEKQKKQILDKQTKQPKGERPVKNPEDDYKNSLYLHPEGGYGFPCSAFKKASVRACAFTAGIPMTKARGLFFVVGQLAKIDGEPVMQEDWVMVGKGLNRSADIRYRGCFRQWSVCLKIIYNADGISLAQLVNLFDNAGFSVGVGDWRPEKDGSNGMFHVDRKS